MTKVIGKIFPAKSYSITLKATADDIRKYVSCQLEKDDDSADMGDSFKNEIIDKIIETADGMLVIYHEFPWKYPPADLLRPQVLTTGPANTNSA